jgi:hypothetical protein
MSSHLEQHIVCGNWEWRKWRHIWERTGGKRKGDWKSLSSHGLRKQRLVLTGNSKVQTTREVLGKGEEGEEGLFIELDLLRQRLGDQVGQIWTQGQLTESAKGRMRKFCLWHWEMGVVCCYRQRRMPEHWFEPQIKQNVIIFKHNLLGYQGLLLCVKLLKPATRSGNIVLYTKDYENIIGLKLIFIT